LIRGIACSAVRVGDRDGSAALREAIAAPFLCIGKISQGIGRL
jgi:hypothetical protein